MVHDYVDVIITCVLLDFSLDLPSCNISRLMMSLMLGFSGPHPLLPIDQSETHTEASSDNDWNWITHTLPFRSLSQYIHFFV